MLTVIWNGSVLKLLDWSQVLNAVKKSDDDETKCWSCERPVEFQFTIWGEAKERLDIVKPALRPLFIFRYHQIVLNAHNYVNLVLNGKGVDLW